MPTPRKAFLSGVKAAVPLFVGVIPFSLMTGLSSVNAGFTVLETIAMSLLVFAGAAQLAVVDLVNQNATEIVIILTGIIINLRFCMYSASLAPHFSGLPFTLRGFLAYLITDAGYAVSIIGFNQRTKHKHFLYLGTSITLWLVWHVALLIGIFVGVLVPPEWPLDFAVPLIFLTLMVMSLTSKYTLIAAVVAVGLMLLTYELPYNLGLCIASLGGVLAGYMSDKWWNNER